MVLKRPCKFTMTTPAPSAWEAGTGKIPWILIFSITWRSGRGRILFGDLARASPTCTWVPDMRSSYVPPSRTDVLLSTFFQDQVKITGALSFTFGSKFEHNAYTGFELEPSAQLVWNPTARQSVWLSAARAIRQPDAVDASIRDDAATFPTGPGSFGVVAVVGNPSAESRETQRL